jgi:hypothetical protein
MMKPTIKVGRRVLAYRVGARREERRVYLLGGRVMYCRKRKRGTI